MPCHVLHQLANVCQPIAYVSKIMPVYSHWAANLDIPPKNWYLDTLYSVAIDGNIYDGCWHKKARTIILEPPNKFSPHASKARNVWSLFDMLMNRRSVFVTFAIHPQAKPTAKAHKQSNENFEPQGNCLPPPHAILHFFTFIVYAPPHWIPKQSFPYLHL